MGWVLCHIKWQVIIISICNNYCVLCYDYVWCYLHWVVQWDKRLPFNLECYTLVILVKYVILVSIGIIFMPGIPAGQNSPEWRCTANMWNLAYWKSDSLLYWDISHTIFHMSKCSKSNWNKYTECFCKWNVSFDINWLSPNITHLVLISWPFREIYIHLLSYWLFSVQFSYHFYWL